MRRLAVVGDHNPEIIAHQAIPRALELARAAGKLDLEWAWVGSEQVVSRGDLDAFDGIWLVPGSPYRSMDGALLAARYAREARLPFLGTCGGFQHAVIEFARNVAKISAADHAETNPHGAELVVTPLACSLVEKTGEISFTPGSRLQAIFGGRPTREGFHCNYGVNASYRARLETLGLRFTGFDPAGEIRAVELAGHPFFIGTLFQPERSALRGELNPLVVAFTTAVAGS